MHSLVSQESSNTTTKNEKETVVAVATLVTEGRIPGRPETGAPKSKGFYEGPHCGLLKRAKEAEHTCDLNNQLCQNNSIQNETVKQLFKRSSPLCIEVFLTCACKKINSDSEDSLDQAYLLERWHICITSKRDPSVPPFNLLQLVNAIRSQLYFSQITAWLVTQAQQEQDVSNNQQITENNIKYRFSTADSVLGSLEFSLTASKHEFPTVDLGNGDLLTVSFMTAPRFLSVPNFTCVNCSFENLEIGEAKMELRKSVFDDRMPTSCTLKGKHRCEEIEETECCQGTSCGKKRLCPTKYKDTRCEASSSKSHDNNMANFSETDKWVDKLCEATTSTCEERKRKISLENRNFTVGFVHELHDPDASTSKCCENKRKISLEHKNFDFELHTAPCEAKSENKRKISLDHRIFTGFGNEIQNSENKRKVSLDNRHFVHENNKDLRDINCDTTPSTRGENKRNLSTDNRNLTLGFVHKIYNNNNLESSDDVWPQELDCCHKTDLKKHKEDKGQILLAAIERSGKNYKEDEFSKFGQKSAKQTSECNNYKFCDMSECDKFSNKKKNKFNIYIDKHCDTPAPSLRPSTKIQDISNLDKSKLFKKTGARQKLTFETGEENAIDIPTPEIANGSYCDIPSIDDKEKFRKNLGNAANMVFHSRTGLPLTSSPAPVRKGKSRFDFDSTLNSVSAIKSALYSSSLSTDDESENEGSIISPCSPDILAALKRDCGPRAPRRKGRTLGLLGSFEESVLNGRLEPVSTVHGFTADLGASAPTGHVPKHIFAPVTVFFYTFSDNDKASSPYLGHINLGKKGYQVPKSGTLQVTLFNPLGTVVKMFVVMYDLTDMPPNSHTFIRQRTLHMPTNCKDKDLPKWLRYLIHLRFMSSKSGKIYLHSDIRMIILHKCEVDTASAHANEQSYDTRSFVQMPEPKYCARK